MVRNFNSIAVQTGVGRRHVLYFEESGLMGAVAEEFQPVAACTHFLVTFFRISHLQEEQEKVVKSSGSTY